MGHTPGPWEASATKRITQARYVGKRIENGKTSMICDLTDSSFQSHAEANAALIAAAPDLLEALKLAQATIARLVTYHGPFNSTQGTQDVVATAIAKAEGRI